jgi:hypothetical protein
MAEIYSQDTAITNTNGGAAKRFSALMPDATMGGKLITAECVIPGGDPTKTVWVGLNSSVSSTVHLWSFRHGDLFIRSANMGPHDRVFPKDYWFATDVDGGGWTFGLE